MRKMKSLSNPKDQTSFTTPMMKQYDEIKRAYPDCLLFFRLGDFYELFMDDALIGSQVLDITLTSRPRGSDGRIPMAGVPYHAVDSYLSKLVKAGYKVAICEQVSEPNKYGLVDREVVRVVTPGTVLDEKALDKKQNNYLVSILFDSQTLALSWVDISTGAFETAEYKCADVEQVLTDELSRLNPSECILPDNLYNNPNILKQLRKQKSLSIYRFSNWDEFATNATSFLKKHFGISTLAGFDIEDKPLCQQTCACLIGYLKHTQKGRISHIKKITVFTPSIYVSLDKSTMINLELFTTIREHDTSATLLSALDDTYTAMGGRLLRNWLKTPLRDREKIILRHKAVEEVLENKTLRENIKTLLVEIGDVERIFSRISVGIGNPRDLINLSTSIEQIIKTKHLLVTTNSTLLQNLQFNISPTLLESVRLIKRSIVEEPPISVRDGGIFKDEVDKKLDKLRQIVNKGKNWIVELEQGERKTSNIPSLKVRYNKVFGYYIEVSKSYVNDVPPNYIRKQTLVNGERYITPELKEQEEILTTAQESIKEIEGVLWLKLVKQILNYTDVIQKASEAISTLDCLVGFANIAERYKYVKPKMLYSGEIKIKDGRHPVVEKLLEGNQFVPNSVSLSNSGNNLWIVTGPNMAGKSVFIRQVALIVLMAQVGSFVPASSAYISVVDKIFVRSGASDVISSGLSTFMVEMVETAYILNQATKDSLIVMDEIGRGTSTYDGISIAWSVAQYLVTHYKNSPKTLFATHYHELQELENHYPKKIKNYHMEVKEENGEPIFLHTILPGGASHSYGVAVAKLAGVPSQVIDNAYQILHSLEKRKMDVSPFANDLQKINLNTLTPLKAHKIVAKLQKKYAKNT